MLVVVSNAIALPAAWLLMREWMGGFAYRAALGPEIFLAAGATGLMFAMGSVAFRAYGAAAANPVDALRYE